MSEQLQLERLNAARLEVQKNSSARERMSKLFDADTFVELDAFAQGGVITGYGEIDGVTVFAFSQDSETCGAAVGQKHAQKLIRMYDMALKAGSPVVGIYDSKGGLIAEGNAMLGAYRDILEKVNNLSGVVPQISLVLGVCGGMTAMAACSADFLIMSENAQLFLTPPATAEDKVVTGTAEAAAKSGVAGIVAEDEDKAVEAARKLLSMLPENNLSAAATFDYAEPDNSALNGIIDTLNDTCKCKLAAAVADSDSTVALFKDFGKKALTAFATIGGYTVGTVVTRGEIDKDSAAKIAKFVSICDSFQIPVVTFINTDGIKPSGADELAGAMRDMARLAHVYAEATTPKIAVITGNAIGSAYVALANADVVLSWPNAIISAMPVKTAVAFLKGSEITAEKTREMVEEEYKVNDASSFIASIQGYVTEVITPLETRARLISHLEMLSGKRVSRLPKKHSNLPM